MVDLESLAETNQKICGAIETGKIIDLAYALGHRGPKIQLRYLLDRASWNLAELELLKQMGMLPGEGATVFYPGIGVDWMLIDAIRQQGGKVVGMNISPLELGDMMLALDFFVSKGFNVFPLSDDYQGLVTLPRRDIVREFAGTRLDERVREFPPGQVLDPTTAQVHQFGYFDHIGGNVFDQKLIQDYIHRFNGGNLFDAIVLKGARYLAISTLPRSCKPDRFPAAAMPGMERLSSILDGVLKEGGRLYVDISSADCIRYFLDKSYEEVEKTKVLDGIKTPTAQVTFHQGLTQFKFGKDELLLGRSSDADIQYRLPSNFFVFRKVKRGNPQGDRRFTGIGEHLDSLSAGALELLKPSNLSVYRNDGEMRIEISDFFGDAIMKSRM